MKVSIKRQFRKSLYLVLLSVIFLSSCSSVAVKRDAVGELTILYTNDEHGWIEPVNQYGGAAGLMGLWEENEGYTENGPFLVLSGGDMWTGPAISTWTHGEAVTAVMNAMGYDAAAIGNHEFDWKIDGIRKREKQAKFPFLSANIREKETGKQPDWAVPYIIEEVNGIKVGVIGLTTTDTPTSTFPTNVKDYDFIPYAEALYEYVPDMKEKGAELIVIVGHFGEEDMVELAPVAKELGIPLICGGHSHQLISKIVDGVAILEAGAHMMYYGKIDILFDMAADTIISLHRKLIANIGGAPDPEIEAIVEHWRLQVDSSLSQVIGYVSRDIPQSSNMMYNMVVDSWLERFPDANISMTNAGGIRQGIPKGEITLKDIVGVLPFENEIVKLELTGQQVIDCMGRFLVGGISSKSKRTLRDGTPIHPDSVYIVLTTDYLYVRSDTPFQKYDPEPEYISINYRQPVVDWIKSLNTSPENPLDKYLDDRSRE